MIFLKIKIIIIFFYLIFNYFHNGTHGIINKIINKHLRLRRLNSIVEQLNFIIFVVILNLIHTLMYGEFCYMYLEIIIKINLT